MFARCTNALGDRVRGTKMDLMAGSWDSGPMERLFVDAAKSWDALDSILSTFGPHVVPGQSLVVHQDFRDFS